jgi:hypothetical protein
MSPEKLKVYRSFLLRCWQEEDISSGQGSTWRFSVEGVSSHLGRQGFNNLHELLIFLHSTLLIIETENRTILAPPEDDHQGRFGHE